MQKYFIHLKKVFLFIHLKIQFQVNVETGVTFLHALTWLEENQVEQFKSRLSKLNHAMLKHLCILF